MLRMDPGFRGETWGTRFFVAFGSGCLLSTHSRAVVLRVNGAPGFLVGLEGGCFALAHPMRGVAAHRMGHPPAAGCRKGQRDP